MEIRPDRQEFERLARDYDVVPVVLELTSDTVTPFTVYSQLAAGGRISGQGAHSRYAGLRLWGNRQRRWARGAADGC